MPKVAESYGAQPGCRERRLENADREIVHLDWRACLGWKHQIRREVCGRASCASRFVDPEAPVLIRSSYLRVWACRSSASTLCWTTAGRNCAGPGEIDHCPQGLDRIEGLPTVAQRVPLAGVPRRADSFGPRTEEEINRTCTTIGIAHRLSAIQDPIRFWFWATAGLSYRAVMKSCWAAAATMPL
jgi:hypothetical protein